MHELTLCQQILRIVQQAMMQSAVRQVVAIHLEIGALVAVEFASLAFHFEILKQNTIASEAQLHWVELPGLALCEACQRKVEITRYGQLCSVCGGFLTTILQGQEFTVKSIEVR